MAYGGTMNYAEDARPEQTYPMDTLVGRLNELGEMVGRANKMASEAERIADAIAGSRPEPVGKDKPSAVPNGIPQQMGMIVEGLHVQLGRIANALERTNNAIGK